jgi:hypothetical protein
VLTGTGLGDDAFLAHAAGEDGLADGVVDLVGAGVIEVFALGVDLGATEFLGEALAVVEARGPAYEFVEVAVELFVEGGVVPGPFVLGVELLDGGDECLGDEDSAVRPEVAGGVGNGGGLRRLGAG